MAMRGPEEGLREIPHMYNGGNQPQRTSTTDCGGKSSQVRLDVGLRKVPTSKKTATNLRRRPRQAGPSVFIGNL